MAKKDVIKNKKSDQIKKQDSTSKFNLNSFANETKQELTKVVWPSRQQLISESAAVMLMVVLVATVVYLVDKLFVFVAGKVF